MSQALPASVFKDPNYQQHLKQSREAALQQLQAGAWFDQPLVSQFADQHYDQGPKLSTQAALSANATGAKILLSDSEFEFILAKIGARAKQMLTYDSRRVEQLNQVIKAFGKHQLTAAHAGQVLAELAFDFEADKVAELEERNDTWVRNQAFDALARARLEAGALKYNVTQAGVLVCPVVNFGALLDVQQKIMHPLQMGVPVTWLVREGVAAQQGTREVMLLRSCLAKAGLASYLNILVLSSSQRETLCDHLKLTTLMTGRSSSAIAIQAKAVDSSTSGSGMSGNFCLDQDIAQSEKFAKRLREDATVATNGRQCTALQGGSGNYQDSAQMADFAKQVLFTQPLFRTPLESVSEQFQNQSWHGAYFSEEPKLQFGYLKLASSQGVCVYETSEQFLGEEVTWGLNGIGLHNNQGSIGALETLLENHDWLSVGYVMNLEKYTQEIDHFVRILNASKATVGTLSGNAEAGCVFSAPQYPGEIFAEKTTHAIGKVWVSHSPRQAPVPMGASFWGPSESLLQTFSEQSIPLVEFLSTTLKLNPIQSAYLNYLNAYLQQALGPQVYERPGRGLSIEGFAYENKQVSVSLYVPDVCYCLKQNIEPVDIAARLLIVLRTSMKDHVKEVRVHPVHGSLVPTLEVWLAASGFSVNCIESDNPDQTTYDRVEAVSSTALRGVAMIAGDVVSMSGARMLHAKLLGAPEDNQVLSTFVKKVSADVAWLTFVT